MGAQKNKNIEAIYPLSPLQQGMLFHYVYNPESATYFEQFSVKLQGDLDVSTFKEAWQTVVQRHGTLRTSFVWKKLDRMLQVVQRHVDIPFVELDWRGMSEEDQKQRLQQYAADDRKKGFQLNKAPLLRFHLIRLRDDLYQFIWSFHHLLADGWSMPIILKEAFLIYESKRAGRPVQLPAVRPYRDYINWLQAQDVSKAQEYWRHLLGDYAPVSLPIIHSEKNETPGERAHEIFELSREISDRLQQTARQFQVTVNTFVQAAWGLLLSRYLRQNDVVFGATFSGRPPQLKGVENMVGMFINTLPVRVRFHREQTIDKILKTLQKQAADTRDVEYTPLVDIQGWIDLPRDVPLFDTIVVFENYPVDSSMQSLPGSIRFSDISSYERSNYPLSLIATFKGQLSVKLAYDAARVEAKQVRVLADQLRAVLTFMAEHPQAKVDALPFTNEEERRTVLYEWNKATLPYEGHLCLHQKFEQTAEDFPQRTALVFKDTTLSFAELNRRANQIAHYLIDKGVKPETPVGLCLERSAEMIIGLLAILKAGGVYVPMDPNYPQERIRFITRDTGMKIALTLSRNQSALTDSGIETLALDASPSPFADLSEENPNVVLTSDNAAYIIYTSGSTGRPKGVVVTHRSVMNLAANLKHLIYDPLGKESVRISLNAPIVFDASMQRIVMMLHGHELHIIPEEIRGDGAAMVRFFRQNKIESADGVPSQLKLMLEAGLLDKGQAKPKVFTTGGEALDADLWQKLYRQNEITFFNMYGPTECTVDASITKVQTAGSRPTIGRALANTRFYVLDEHLQPVPLGAPGELCVGGAGLARGYLNRPDLTALAFVPDPFAEEAGARMYRTGDLVRWRPDGMLEFLGRIDHQVKLRGFRIELGEIENALRLHPQIKDAVVLLRQDDPNNPFLAAYCIHQGEQTPERNEIRAFLKQHLPDYMVPAAYVFMESFPVTASGKIYHRAFPKPQESDLGGGEKIAPRTASEELLATLWKDILKVKEVGATDNFFDLGGHSLLATQLVSRVRDAFGIELPLRQIFETPVLADLALKIDEMALKDQELQAPPITPVPREGDLPLSFAQQRLWFLDQLAPGTANYNTPSAFRLKGTLNIDVLKQSIEEVVRRHEILRTTFAQRDGDPIQIIHDSMPVDIPFSDLSGLPEEEKEAKAREIARQDALTPFDLAKGPLFRLQLLKFAENDHLVLINLHHIITDGWSMGVLIREIATLYNAFAEGKPSPLPELPVQYADYAVWQRNWLQGEVLQKQLDFWKNYIGENPPVLELPTDHPRPAMQTFNGKSLRYDLPPELSRQVQTFSQKQGATLFMTLLAAFQSLLRRYTRQDQILVGSPIANRTRSETEQLIGFFVNTLVFKADFSAADDFKSLLKQVRENTLQAYAHQDLPFEQLVEALQPERDMSHSPLFQVAFILQNAPFERLQLKHLTVEPFQPENPTAKYDLTLYTSESDEGIVTFWEFNTDLFEEATIRRMMEHFRNLLTAVVKEPGQKVDAIDFLTSREKQLLFEEWNATQRDFPDNTTVHALFEALAQTQPEAPAVRYHEQEWTYAQLNARANQLAHFLLQKGIRTDEIVGISLPRGLDVPVAILGILKAGGAFLNIDPTYPQERIRYMIEDSGLRFVITTETLAQALPLGQAEAIVIEKEQQTIAAQADTNPERRVMTENLAYVIYTSGSTGKPKGTLLPHRGLCNLAKAQQRAFNITRQSRILQFASLSFDASVWETVMALLNGATLVYTDQETLVTGQGLHSVLKEQKITTITLPPSVLAVMPQDALPDLQTIITAGEKCTRDLVQRWGQNRQFVNAYGPTETTVCASMYQTSEDEDREPPIGKPIDNFRLYVVDENLQAVPIGVPGELCIAGVGLARGYLNRPDLTAERFVPDPFTKEPGARMYRSGDLVRWLPDGNLEFLGRIDHQVKVRGFRIELGEIEAVLTSHEKIRDAAVLVREDKPGEQRLVGYYVTEDGQPLAANQLKAFLKNQLPEYMVPTAFVHLKAMPLTPNGKVDRKALPAPEFSRSDLQTEYVAPRNENEEKLAAIVSELLHIEKVGVFDNFFDLGGHSLLATKFMSRIREQFNVELPLRTLFEKPTIAELAIAIDESHSDLAGESIERVERETLQLDDVLAELEDLSDEEVRRLLDEEAEEDDDDKI